MICWSRMDNYRTKDGQVAWNGHTAAHLDASECGGAKLCAVDGSAARPPLR
jgi:hypothetical protein